MNYMHEVLVKVVALMLGACTLQGSEESTPQPRLETVPLLRHLSSLEMQCNVSQFSRERCLPRNLVLRGALDQSWQQQEDSSTSTRNRQGH